MSLLGFCSADPHAAAYTWARDELRGHAARSSSMAAFPEVEKAFKAAPGWTPHMEGVLSGAFAIFLLTNAPDNPGLFAYAIARDAVGMRRAIVDHIECGWTVAQTMEVVAHVASTHKGFKNRLG